MGNLLGYLRGRSSESKDENEPKKARQKCKKKLISSMWKMSIDDIRCGIACCKPQWMQVFATREMYLLIYCTVGLVIGMFFTYSVSTISTVEKRFKISSKQTGIILAGNDVSQVLLSILIAYFGNYGNRPKWLGIGVFCASLSCFLSVVPHYIYGPGQDAIDVAFSMDMALNYNASTSMSDLANSQNMTNKDDLCYAPYTADCGKHNGDSAYIGPVVIFFLAEFLVGISVTAFYSLGLAYLDDNVNKKDSPIYYAVSMIVRVVGPVLGFFLGSKCLSIYIDPYNKPNISLRDPRWLGAWWLGYLLLGFLLAFCSIFLLLLPRVLPCTFVKQIERVLSGSETPFVKSFTEIVPSTDIPVLLKMVKAKQRHTKPSLSKLPAALKRLFTNKIYVGTNINTVLMLLAMMGYWSFKPKYLEYQFRISASTANFYAGVASLVASILGLSISGLIIKLFRPRPRFIAGYSCFLTLYSSIMMIALMFIGCPKLDIVGPNSNPNSDLFLCSSDCGCTDRYSPVCSDDNVTTFYSSCYAGCKVINSSVSPVEYYDCKCINSNFSTNNSTSPLGIGLNEMPNILPINTEGGGRARQGYCPEKCDTFFYYIVITILTKTVDSTGRIGGTLMYLRSLEEHDKGLALGVSTVLLSLFAFIPAPIIMGAVVDSACIIWDNTCGQKGNCWLYDSDKFRILIHVLPAIIILISLFGDIIIFIYSKDLVLYGEDEEKKIPEDMRGTERANEREMAVLEPLQNGTASQTKLAKHEE